MINLDDRALIEWDENETFFMLHLTKRMGANATCFPSIHTIISDTRWSKSKVLRIKEQCVAKGILSSEMQFDSNGSQKSNLYTVKTNMLAVYINMQGAGGVEGVSKTIPPPYQKRYPPRTKNDTGGGVKTDTLSINQLEVLKSEVLVNTPAPEKIDLDLIQPNQTAHVLPCEENDILKRQKEILLNQKREAEAVLSLKTELSIWDSHSTLFDAIRKEYDDEIETQDVRDVKKQYQLQGMTFDLSHLENMLDTFCRKIITQEEQVNISLKVAKSRFFTSFIKNMSRFSPQIKKEEQKPSETLNYLILRNNLDKLLEQGTITEKDYKKQMNCFRDKIGTTKTVTAEYFQTILKSYAQ